MFLNYACNGFELLEVESQISFFITITYWYSVKSSCSKPLFQCSEPVQTNVAQWEQFILIEMNAMQREKEPWLFEG